MVFNSRPLGFHVARYIRHFLPFFYTIPFFSHAHAKYCPNASFRLGASVDDDEEGERFGRFIVARRWASRDSISHATSGFDACAAGTFVRSPSNPPVSHSFPPPSAVGSWAALREAVALSLSSVSSSSSNFFLHRVYPIHPRVTRATASAPERVLDLRRLHGAGRFIFIPYDSFDWTWLVVTTRAIYFRYYGTTFQLPWSRESLVSFAHIARPPLRAAATRRPRVKYVRSSLE